MSVGYLSTQSKSPSLSLKRQYEWEIRAIGEDVKRCFERGTRRRKSSNGRHFEGGRMLGKEYPNTLANKYVLASTLHKLGRYEEA